MDGNGYNEEGFEEWAEEWLRIRPSITEIFRMEEELSLRHIDDRKLIKTEDALAYYRELKARLEEKNRKTA